MEKINSFVFIENFNKNQNQNEKQQSIDFLS